MAHEDNLGITDIASQLATRMPTKGVPETEVKQAIRNTLHYAEKAGILGELSDTIEAQARGDVQVSVLADALRKR